MSKSGTGSLSSASEVGKGSSLTSFSSAEKAGQEGSADDDVVVAMSSITRLERRRSMHLRDDWSEARQRLAGVLDSPWFDLFMGTVVASNILVMIRETDHSALCLKQTAGGVCNIPRDVEIANKLFLSFYVLELILQISVFRRNYFKTFWSNLDTGIVVTSIVAEVVGSVARNLKPLRLLRLLRLTRVVRALGSFRELYMMLHGMIVTLKAVFWSAVLMFGLITVWSIISVEVLYPEVQKVAADGGYADCDWCLDALSSVFDADLTLFEVIVLGENFGALALPLAKSGGSFVALPILFGVFFTVVIGLMNLVLAVIVDFAVDAREEDEKMQSLTKDKKRKEAKQQLMNLCIDMDTDAGGTLTFEEFMNGFENSARFRTIMETLDVDKQDGELVFRIMDVDHSGDVSYKELTDLLYKMKAQNSRTLLLFIKHYSMEIRRMVNEELHLVRDQVSTQLDNIASIVGGSLEGQSVNACAEASPDSESGKGKDSGRVRSSSLASASCESLMKETPTQQSAVSSLDLPGAVVSINDKKKTPTQQSAGVSKEATEWSPVVPLDRAAVTNGEWKRRFESESSLPREQATTALLDMDRLDKLDMKIDKNLAALQSHIDRQVREQCDSITSQMRKGFHECKENFDDLLIAVQANQSTCRASVSQLASSGVNIQGIPMEELESIQFQDI